MIEFRTQMLLPALLCAHAGVAIAAGKVAGDERMLVFKPDGSRQCEPDSGIPLQGMRKQLADAGVEVFTSRTTTDGMVRAQVCGAPTGRLHVFGIDAADASAAAELGFRPAPGLSAEMPQDDVDGHAPNQQRPSQ
jgi:hypothetical protein